jgi:hypothetical protein
MADMIPVYLVACWIMGLFGGFAIGNYYASKKFLNKLDAILGDKE